MEAPRNIVFNTDEVFVIVDNRLEKRVANIIKVNEKTLLFNGLKEGEILVMQPLINVLEGTLVERLGEGQTGPGPGADAATRERREGSQPEPKNKQEGNKRKSRKNAEKETLQKDPE